MLNWLFMYINFLALDIATAVIPMQFFTFFVLSWTVLNITSSLANFPVSAAFYRFGYALPGHNWYTTFITIVTGGMVNRLYQSLPILFSWLLVLQIAIIPVTNRRCRKARELEEKMEEAETQPRLEKTNIDSIDNGDTSSEEERVVFEVARLAREQTREYSPSVPLPFIRSV